MPLSGGMAGPHDDSLHQGNAKRDVANGLAGLDAQGDLIAVGDTLELYRDPFNGVYFVDRKSGEKFLEVERLAGNDYEFSVMISGTLRRILNITNKNVANGIAALDAAGSLLVPGSKIYYTRDGSDDVHIYERTSDEEAYAFHRVGADDYTLFVKESNVWKQVQTEGMKDVADGIAGLDANAVIAHERIRVGSFRAEHRRKVISNDLRHSHDSEDSILSGSWAKYKTITMTNGISGTLRIKHSSYSENGLVGATHSRVYKNGSPLGADNENSNSMAYQEFSEDLNVGDLQPGDTLELWAKDMLYPDSRSVKEFRLYYVNEASTVVASANS